MAAGPLGSGFPEPDMAVWRGLVAKLVEGGEEALVRRSYDGLEIRPLYRPGTLDAQPERPGAPSFVRGALPLAETRPWNIRQRVSHPDPRIANAQLKEELAGGAGSVLLRTDESVGLGGAVPDGILVYEVADLARLLDGLPLATVPIVLEAGWRYGALAALLLGLWRQRDLPLERFGVPIGADPLGAAIRGAQIDLDVSLARAVEVTLWFERKGLAVGTLLADGHPYHAGGASAAQELGCMLATATAYLRGLDAAGLPPDQAARRIAFRLAVDADVFTSIVKLRALRCLWHRVTEACGATARGMQVEAVTARRMMATRDVHVNMLRTTAAAFAAAAGGADAITVLPFDYALGEPTDLARRLARNIQLVLRHESGLDRVIDPAGGSAYVEASTLSLAREAWGIFQLIEGGGGMVPMLLRGSVQEWIAETWDLRAANIARRIDHVTGVTDFPNLAERPHAPVAVDGEALAAVARQRLERAFDTTKIGFDEVIDAAAAGAPLLYRGPIASYTPIQPRRLGEAFEALRDRSDAFLARDGYRPRVCLVEIGPPAQSKPRTDFACSLFAAGGLEAVTSGPIADPAAARTALDRAGALLAALCGSDAAHAELADPIVRALAQAGAARIWLIGRPAAIPPALAEALAGTIAPGDDLLQILADAYAALGEV